MKCVLTSKGPELMLREQQQAGEQKSCAHRWPSIWREAQYFI